MKLFTEGKINIRREAGKVGAQGSAVIRIQRF
jgi:hypothetical protein